MTNEPNSGDRPFSLPEPKTLPKPQKPAKPAKSRRPTPAERRERLRRDGAAVRTAVKESAWRSISDAAKNSAASQMLKALDEIFEASPRKPGDAPTPADPRVIVLSKWHSLPQPIVAQIISLVEPFPAWINKSAVEDCNA